MHDMEFLQLQSPRHRPRFWIGACCIHPDDLTIAGPSGKVGVEPKIMSVLIALCEHSGETLMREELIEAVWKREFGADESLTRAISQLRKVFRDKYNMPNVIETVPRHGYRLLLPVSPAPPQASSAPSAIPEPVLANTETPHASRHRHPGRKLILPAAGAVAVLGLVAAGMGLSARPPPIPATRQLVEGPLNIASIERIGADHEVERAASTLGGALSDALVRNGIPSAMSDFNKALPLLVQADISRDREDLIVTTRLVDRERGTVIWSHLTRGPAEDIPRLLARAGNRLADTLVCARSFAGLLPEGSSDLIVRYTRLCPEPAASHELRAVFLNDAIARDLQDIRARGLGAWKDVAVALWADEDRKPGQESPELESALARADAVLASDPHNFFANIARAAYDCVHRQDYHSGIGRLELAAASPSARSALALRLFHAYRLTGRLDDAIRVAAEEVERHPDQTFLRTELAWVMVSKGYFEATYANFDIAEYVHPELEILGQRRRQLVLFNEDPAAAMNLLYPNAETPTDDVYDRCFRRYLEVRISGSRDITAWQQACGKIQADIRIRMLSQLGEIDKAFELLEANFPDFEWAWPFMFYPETRAMRDHPLFWKFAHSIKLDAYWKASGHWPDFCEDEPLRTPCAVSAERAASIYP